MRDYYGNYDPEEVDIRGHRTRERRVFHIVSTALSMDTLKDAILFTFEDHPIIPGLVRNPGASLDGLLEEMGISLDQREMGEMEELEMKLSTKKRTEKKIMDLLEWVVGYCDEFVISNKILIKVTFIIISNCVIVICW